MSDWKVIEIWNRLHTTPYDFYISSPTIAHLISLFNVFHVWEQAWWNGERSGRFPLIPHFFRRSHFPSFGSYFFGTSAIANLHLVIFKKGPKKIARFFSSNLLPGPDFVFGWDLLTVSRKSFLKTWCAFDGSVKTHLNSKPL